MKCLFRPSPRLRVRLLVTAGLICAPVCAAQTAQPPSAQLSASPDSDTPPPEPIISDAAFDQALEPLSDFDSELDAGVSETPLPELPGAPSDAATDISTDSPQTSLVPAPAPSPDLDELAAEPPLVPLSDFRDIVPDAGSAAFGATAPVINYEVRINGLPERSMAGRFKPISALYGGKGRAANPGMLRARAREDEVVLLRLLKSEGYFDATARIIIDANPDWPNHVTARIDVEPGTPYRLDAIEVTGAPTEPADLARDALELNSGEPVEAARIIAAEARISLRLPENGYPFASVGARDIGLDPATHTADYTVPVDPGPRATFAGITVEGDPVLEPDHIAILARFSGGELYDSRDVDDLRQALVATGLYRAVAVEPVRTGRRREDGTEELDLKVTQAAGPARTLSGEAGYSTGQGLSVSGSWTHRNLFPPEGALVVSGALGTEEQEAALTLRRANAGQRDRTAQGNLSYSHTNYNAYEAFSTGLAASIALVSTPLWQKEWTWSLGFEALSSRESDIDLTTGLNTFTTYDLITLPAQIGWDRTDDLLDPTTGYRLTAQAVPQLSLRGSRPSSVKTQFDASGYWTLGTGLVLASRSRLAVLEGGSLMAIAPSRRIYAGGGGSVRGFSYQALGPLDVTGDPTGGLSAFEASVELRYRFGGDGLLSGLGIVPFIDIGQVYASPLPDMSDLRVGLGVGARYYTNFGPVRIDVATPVSRRDDEPPVTLYVGIGQAF